MIIIQMLLFWWMWVLTQLMLLCWFRVRVHLTWAQSQCGTLQVAYVEIICFIPIKTVPVSLCMAPTNRTHIKYDTVKNSLLWKVGKQVQPGLTGIDLYTEWNYTVEATRQPDLSVYWRSTDCRLKVRGEQLPVCVWGCVEWRLAQSKLIAKVLD